MTIIFKVKTNEAYRIKILTELLCSNLKTACFEINKKGIFLKMTDNQRKILINVELHSSNFPFFTFTKKEPMFVGINLNHLHRMVKSVKKKDKIEMYIDDKHPQDLAIKTIPKEYTRITTSYIKIQNIQNIVVDEPVGYNNPILVNSNEYHKMCKDMINIGNNINITATKYRIKFTCDTEGVLKRTVEFGEYDDDCIDDEHKKNIYDEFFTTDQLSRIVKISGLNNIIKIFTNKDLPLLLKSSIGNIGEISLFIKSFNQLE